MKFNEKIKLKTKGKTVVLLLIITLSMTAIANLKANVPDGESDDTKINTSSPIEPIYRYNYENDFNYYWHAAIIGNFFPVKFVEGYNTEWSQNPYDNNILKLNFGCTFWGSLAMLGHLYVVSQNEFQKTSNPDLGAYIDWKMVLGINFILSAVFESVILSLLISLPTGEFETVFYHPTLTDFTQQQGQLYLPNFDRFIWDDGKIRFLLGAAFIGVTPAIGGRIEMGLSFQGLRVVQELIPHKPEAEERTLFYVHGWSITGAPTPNSFWNMFTREERFIEFYGDNFHIISYYGTFMGEIVDTHTSIAEIARLLALYIMFHHASISDNIDFITHSMGGLVVRWMIKFFYEDIKNFYLVLGRNINIRNVCTIATPNHGVWYGWVGAILLNEQGKELQAGSPFMLIINFPPETPYIGSINWFTYAGGKFLITDGIVEIISVPLIGATNRGLYPFDHGQMITEYGVHIAAFNDLYRFPYLIQSILFLNVPGKIVSINELILEPDPDTPEGEALFSITLPMEDVISIYPSTVRLHVHENTYVMTLKEGTTDTFEVNLPLVEDSYPFVITALEIDGGLYRIWGSFKIIDDDIQPPDIQITPEDLFFSDEEAVGGVLVSWEITDYSGISEAKVTLNGEVIRNYADEESISDSHLLPNILGVYTFSFSARDDDNDPGHDPPGEDWLEDLIERTYTIYDDDIDPPEIYITPGDLLIYDGEAIGGVLVSWEISDYSGISEATVELNGAGIFSYGQTEGPILDSYLLPNEPGVYTFSIWARDGDNDLRDDPLEQDWSESSIERTITIYDDDTDEPYFENLMIADDHLWLNISFTGIDDLQLLGDGDEGLSNVEVYVDSNLIHSDSSPSYETVFDFPFSNDWIWELGIHNITIDITDADDDRISDSLSNTIYGQFEVTLDEMYQYVMWLCEEMNNYIYDNDIVALFGVVTQKLVKIQTLLWDAYQLIQDGYLHSGLVRQKMAEIKLEIAETKTGLMISKQSMSQEHFDHLQECIRDVRNRIVELMGLGISVFSHEISLVEVDVYNLRDFVEDNINATDSENLVNAITLTAAKLENAIFDISLDKSTEGSLTSAQNALDNVKTVVVALAGKGKISEELKLELLAKIILIQVKIELLKQQI